MRTTVEKFVRAYRRGPETAQRVSRDLLQRMRRARITLGSTIDLRQPVSGTRYADGVVASRDFLRQDSAVIQREIVNWNLLDEETKDSPFSLADERTHLHLQLLFDRKDKLLFANLADPKVHSYFSDLSSRFYSFLRKHLSLGSISLHLGFSAIELDKDPVDGHSIPKSTVFTEAETYKRVVFALNTFRNNVRALSYTGPLLIETLDYQVDAGRSAYAHVAEPAFIRKVLSATGYGLLLDPAHLLISAWNKGYSNPMLYLEEMISGVDLRLLREIHISVPEKGEHRWLDNHRPLGKNLDDQETKTMLAMFALLLQRRSVLGNSVPLYVNFESPVEALPEDMPLIAEFIGQLV